MMNHPSRNVAEAEVSSSESNGNCCVTIIVKHFTSSHYSFALQVYDTCLTFISKQHINIAPAVPGTSLHTNDPFIISSNRKM